MKTTYLIENLNDKSVFNYYKRLCDAKEDLEVLDSKAWKLDESQWRILVLKGSAFGEGRHAYQVTYAGRVFLKQKI